MTLRRQRGMAIIAIILGMLFFGILGMTMVSLVNGDLASSTEGYNAAQAFYVAEGGVQYVEMNELNGDTDFSDNVSPTDAPFGASSISLPPGEFWVEYSDQGSDSVTLKVTARVGDAVRVIQQTAGQGGSGSQYVTMAGGNLNMNSSTGNLYGDVAMQGNYSIAAGVTVHGNITQDPTIELPTIDFDTYKDMCTSSYVGNKTIAVNTTANLCVTGKVTINAGVTYNGLLYATQDVKINGNNVHVNGTIVTEKNFSGSNLTGLQFNAQPGSEPGTHMPAILADGNFDLKNDDNMTINGVVWNDGNLDFTNSDNLNFTGSFVAGGNVLINSATNVTVTFDSDLVTAIPGLSGGFGSAVGSLSLSSWHTY